MVVAATATAANGVLLVVNLSIYQNWLLLFLFSSLFLSRFVWNFQWLQLINHNDNIRVDVYVWASVCVFVYFVFCIVYYIFGYKSIYFEIVVCLLDEREPKRTRNKRKTI